MIDRPLSDILADAETFGKEELPVLAEKVKAARMAIYRAYVTNGKPQGEGKENALLWFNGLYEQWQAKKGTLQEQLNELAIAQQQLVMVGDLEGGDSLKATPKGLARQLVLTASVFVSQADIEGRGLTETEKLGLVHLMLLVLTEMRHV